MRKEIVRGFMMLMLIVAVAFMTAVTSANGQSRTVVANVPFEFNVGDQVLPSGKYAVRERNETGSTLLIENRKSGKSAMRLTNSIRAWNAPENAKLVFHRYGPRYFLAEVWTSGEKTGRQLLKSKEERTIESQLAAVFPKNERDRNYEIVEIVATVY